MGIVCSISRAQGRQAPASQVGAPPSRIPHEYSKTRLCRRQAVQPLAASARAATGSEAGPSGMAPAGAAAPRAGRAVAAATGNGSGPGAPAAAAAGAARGEKRKADATAGAPAAPDDAKRVLIPCCAELWPWCVFGVWATWRAACSCADPVSWSSTRRVRLGQDAFLEGTELAAELLPAERSLAVPASASKDSTAAPAVCAGCAALCAFRPPAAVCAGRGRHGRERAAGTGAQAALLHLLPGLGCGTRALAVQGGDTGARRGPRRHAPRRTARTAAA